MLSSFGSMIHTYADMCMHTHTYTHIHTHYTYVEWVALSLSPSCVQHALEMVSCCIRAGEDVSLT